MTMIVLGDDKEGAVISSFFLVSPSCPRPFKRSDMPASIWRDDEHPIGGVLTGSKLDSDKMARYGYGYRQTIDNSSWCAR